LLANQISPGPSVASAWETNAHSCTGIPSFGACKDGQRVSHPCPVPILLLPPVLTMALICPYMCSCEPSMISQHTAMQYLTRHERTTACCTYGWLLSVAMENHKDGLDPKWLTSSSRRPNGWRSLMAIETERPCKRSSAWIREQWHLYTQVQVESGLLAREYWHLLDCRRGHSSRRSFTLFVVRSPGAGHVVFVTLAQE